MSQAKLIARRRFLKQSALLAAGASLPMGAWFGRARANPLAPGLSDPAMQPKFQVLAPNALHRSFRFKTNHHHGRDDEHDQEIEVKAVQTTQYTGLVGTDGVTPVPTTVFGFGHKDKDASWPGKTFVVERGRKLKVTWENELPYAHILPVDTSIHWCYSLPGYEQYSIANSGVPIVTHLHGGHTRSAFDGGPEYFFGRDFDVVGPRWEAEAYTYDNDQAACALWYHDHALGITRLNVYAGLAGFYFIRDEVDTGTHRNPLGLPAGRYELAYLIQDRMFWNDGRLFYPAFPGDPAWDDFITAEGVTNPPVPSVLAEFFGDHMTVNGRIWPRAQVEPRHYRLRLLNGCDSRFLAIRFRPVPAGATDLSQAGAPLPFWVVGFDQGLAAAATQVDTLLIAPSERPDIVVDFSQVPMGTRVIMENIAGDAPFGGLLVGDPGFDVNDLFPNRQTDRIMAFDVVRRLRRKRRDRFDPTAIAHYAGNANPVTRVRKLALFEGRDQYGRLQPLLGVAEPTTDMLGNVVNGALPWHVPVTENPGLGDTEIWEIYNATEDAHPIHVHLVNFEILDRQGFTADVIQQPVLQHDGTTGIGYRLENIALTGTPIPPGGVERAPKDVVTALPGQVTRIKMTFDRPERYVWHCHILSHEDHEMMRPFHVGPYTG